MNSQFDWKTQCEMEPLAYSGKIQPHGALIYLNERHCVSHVSAQIEDYIDLTPMSLLGRPLPEKLAHILAPAIKKLSNVVGSRCQLLGVGLASDVFFDIVLTQGSHGITIEFFAHNHLPLVFSQPLEQIVLPDNEDQLLVLHQNMVELFQRLTGFHRVMIYIFRDDGDGHVIAEARDAKIYSSYLDLRFPGSDIPQIARTLYLKNPWRLIPDAEAQTIDLIGEGLPDLTWSDLRSVSPIHLAYLANMGVRASLSLPIVVTNKLSGLVACHHADPRNLSLQVLDTASRIVKHYSLIISSFQANRRIRFMDSLTGRLQLIRMALIRHGSILNTAAAEIAPELFKLFGACGLAIRFADEWLQVGEVAPFDSLEQMDEWFECQFSDVIFTSDSLIRTNADFGLLPVAGTLALKMQTRSRESLHLWFFRSEVIHEIAWGGNPNKPVELHEGEFKISPRLSFEKWVEKSIGYCLPWKNEDRIAALQLRNLFLEIYG